ncbi:MAG: hypothetical protein ACLGG9_09250 [Thermoleophilia bacterium]|jgi:hypothetical protein
MTRRTLRAGLAAVGLAALLALPSLASALTIPNIPGLPPGVKVPTVTGYWATLDTAGYVKVRVTENNARECTPGRDTLGEYEAEFELGAPRRVRVVVVNGDVSSNGVRSVRRSGAGAVHKAKYTVTRETNNCAPAERVDLGPPPACKPVLRGRLLVSLFPTPREKDPELTPLVRRVSVGLQRIGGGRQSLECMGVIPGLSAKVRDDESSVHPMQLAQLPLTVPVATDRQLLSLKKKGQTLRRSVRINGACNDFLMSNAVQNQSGYNCTVTGRIVVNIKRTA